MNTRTIKELLQSVPLFKDLTDDELTPIINLARYQKYQRGSYVFLQGDSLTDVYFIYQGKVKIYKTDVHGREQIVNILQGGNMFPHQGFFRQDEYPANAEISEDAVLIYIPIQPFENVLLNHPEICVKLLRVLGNIIVDLQERLEEKLLHNTYEQIIMLLLRLSRSYGQATDNGGVRFTTLFTNRELASMIGSSRETINRTLTQLKNQKLVTTSESGALVLDTDAMKEKLF
ncbi:Crp/Fnr family transcriptional regulator [Barrientosiimonas marina]|uniref:Crp/Fnr family transcriptional regulator n=1 Tax=Lentibacillus kimchii TaxID=1542911 RepID=A0ABW2UV99_9BACI